MFSKPKNKSRSLIPALAKTRTISFILLFVLGSMSLNLTAQSYPSGNGSWNVYAWNSNGANSWDSNYRGYYVDSGTNFNSTSKWDQMLSPSSAAGYVGDTVVYDNHSFSAKRRGFPAGYYSLVYSDVNERAEVWVNSVKVWELLTPDLSAPGSIHYKGSYTIWTGNLGPTDSIEFRVANGTGASVGKLHFDKPNTVAGNKIYVDSSNINNAAHLDGNSWATAFRSIKDAFLAANLNPGVDSILVAKGRYAAKSVFRPDDITDSLAFRNNLKVLGGYPSGGGTRNYEIYESTIYQTRISFVNIDSTAILDGFQFLNVSKRTSFFPCTLNEIFSQTNCPAKEMEDERSVTIMAKGSGQKCNPIIQNCKFGKHNPYYDAGRTYAAYTIGRGMYIYAKDSATAYPTITNCNFDGCGGLRASRMHWGLMQLQVADNVYGVGDAIHIRTSSQGINRTKINRSIFENSTRSAVFVQVYTGLNAPEISECVFTNNSSAYGITANNGGAAITIFPDFGRCLPVIKNSIFANNRNFYLSEGAESPSTLSTISILDKTDIGTGNPNSSLKTTIYNCTFFNNSKSINVSSPYDTVLVYNSIFDDSKGPNEYFPQMGPGFLNLRQISTSFAEKTKLHLQNCIMNEGFIFGQQLIIPDLGEGEGTYFMPWDYPPQISLTYSGYAGTSTPVYANHFPKLESLEPVLHYFPKYNFAGADRKWFTADDNLQLVGCSPGVDSGINSHVVSTTDIMGNNRIINGTVDLGAYESNQNIIMQAKELSGGFNCWNVYAWNAGGASSPGTGSWVNKYSGYYADTVVNFDSRTKWNASLSPSHAPGFKGCSNAVGVDNHSFIAKRKGFPCGKYQLSIEADDEAQLWINDTMVWSHAFTGTVHNNVWTGALGANDLVELRVTEGTGQSFGKITLNLVAAGNPNVPGYNKWNVYLWHKTDWATDYRGFYTDSSLHFYTESRWPANASPVRAVGFQDSLTCIQVDSFSYVANRKGFPAGYYRLNVLQHDDDVEVWVNNSMVFQRTGSGGTTNNIWQGYLCGSDSIKYKSKDFAGNAIGKLEFVLVPANDPGNPAIYGDNVWRVYAWDAGSATSNTGNSWNTNYSGYYIDSTFNFNSENKWNRLTTPSGAPGFIGCDVTNDNHSWSAKRKGFPCGYYQIDVPGADDEAQLWINGIMVWSHVHQPGGVYNNVWQGFLNATDSIEFRVTEGGGDSYGQLNFVQGSQALTNNNALNFDGTNDYVEIKTCPGNSLNFADSMTIEYWFKGTNIQSAIRLQPDNNSHIISGYGNNHFVRINNMDYTVAVGNATDNNWHHVAMTWQRNTTGGFKSYLDGQLIAQSNTPDASLPTISSGMWLGSLLGIQEYMNGSLDNVRIWKSVRSQTQIQDNMFNSCEFNATQPNLLLFYTFDHGTANANNSTITGIRNLTAPNIFPGVIKNLTLNSSASNFVEGTFQEFNWLGTISNDWLNPSNWGCGQLPNKNSIIKIDAGRTFYPLQNVGGEIYKLILQTGSSITVPTGNNLIITGK